MHAPRPAILFRLVQFPFSLRYLRACRNFVDAVDLFRAHNVCFTLLLIVISTGCKVKPSQNLASVTMLESPAGPGSGEPYLVTDENGYVRMSWIEKNDDQSRLMYSYYLDDNWSNPVLIDSGRNWFVNWADYPMTANNEDHVLAHYLEKSGAGKFAYDVQLMLSTDSGRNWKQLGTLHDDGKEAEHGFVSMVRYEDGFFLAWLDGRNAAGDGHEEHADHQGQMTLRAAVTDQQGRKLQEWELDNRTCDCCQTDAAIAAGGPVVVYRDRSDDEVRDIAIVRFENGSWTQPQVIHRDNWKIAGCPVNGPALAASGDLVGVAWYTAPSDNYAVYVAFSKDSGRTFADPVRVDEGDPVGRVDLVMMEDQSAMVSWMEGSMIKAVRVHADGRKDDPITIVASSKSRSSGFPQMVRSGNSLIFAWTDDKEKLVKVGKVTL